MIAFLLAGCEREVEVDEYPVPPDAKSMRDGSRFVVLRAGDGPLASTAQIWGVEEKLISHTTPDCSYPCRRYMLRPVSDRYHDGKREWLATMREGEVRRVWIVGLDGKRRVFDFELASAIRTDSAGQPIIDNQ